MLKKVKKQHEGSASAAGGGGAGGGTQGECGGCGSERWWAQQTRRQPHRRLASSPLQGAAAQPFASSPQRTPMRAHPTHPTAAPGGAGPPAARPRPHPRAAAGQRAAPCGRDRCSPAPASPRSPLSAARCGGGGAGAAPSARAQQGHGAKQRCFCSRMRADAMLQPPPPPARRERGALLLGGALCQRRLECIIFLLGGLLPVPPVLHQALWGESGSVARVAGFGGSQGSK